MNLGSRNVKVIHNLASDAFRANPDREVDPNLILFVGVLHENKGIRHLVLAMLQVLKEYPHARLRAVGRDVVSRRTGKSFLESELLL